MPYVFHLLELSKFWTACVINHFYATMNAVNIYGGVFVIVIIGMPEA